MSSMEVGLDTHKMKNIIALENGKSRETKLVDGMKHLEYEEGLSLLQLSRLAYHRLLGDMNELYKRFSSYDKGSVSPSLLPIMRPSRQQNFQPQLRRSRDGIIYNQTLFIPVLRLSGIGSHGKLWSQVR